jgi:dTMP kinase
MRSLFLVVEGLDGSGGTTQVGRLAAALRSRGRSVVETCEPSPLPIGRLIRSALRDPSLGVSDAALAWLFAGDRHEHVEQVVQPALRAGSDVISDRYLLSSLAYQSGAVGLQRVLSLNDGFPAPDLTIFLDLPVEVSLARVRARGEPAERFEALERLSAVRAAYETALETLRARGERIAHIDASGTPEEVGEAVLSAVTALLGAS